MDSFAVLDLAVALFFLYLLLSTLVTLLNEWVAQWFQLRAQNLHLAIQQMLGSDDRQELSHQGFFDHPLIADLARPAARWGKVAWALEKVGQKGLFGIGEGKNLPAYIASNKFSAAVVDLLLPVDDQGRRRLTLVELRARAEDLPDGALRRKLLLLIDQADGELASFRTALETWFDDTMERATGWYKRYIQRFTLAFAVIVTLALNADSIAIGQALWQDREALRQWVAAAELYVAERQTAEPTAGDGAADDAAPATPAEPASDQSVATQLADDTGDQGSPDGKEPTLEDKLTDLQKQLDPLRATSVPLGWSEANRPTDAWGWFTKVMGLLVTALAVSMGSSYWFELLAKLINLRNAGVALRRQVGTLAGGAEAPSAGGNGTRQTT